MPLSLEVGGAWKAVSAIAVEVGGAWKTVPAVWREVGGVWKQVVQSVLLDPRWQFVGSSSTAGTAADTGLGFTERAAYYLGWAAAGQPWFVDGIGSTDLENFWTRFATNCEPHYDPAHVNVVILQHGINDLGSAVDVYNDLVAFCTNVKALHSTNKWKIIVLTNQHPKQNSADFNARVDAYDAMYRDNADFYNGTLADGVIWVHTRPALTNAIGPSYSADGRHLNNTGHDILGRIIADELPAAMAGQCSVTFRPTVSITAPSSFATVYGTITVTASATGAAELELWAGKASDQVQGPIELAKVGTTISGNSGSWNIDTTAWTDNSTYQLAVFAKNAAGLGQITERFVSVSQAAGGGAPAITTQPQSQNVDNGTSVTVSIVATGTPAPTYQWQYDSGSGYADISGATSSSYQFTASLSTVGSYRCVVTNSNGTVTSQGADIGLNAGAIRVHDTFSGSGTLNARTPDTVGAMLWAQTQTFTVSGGTVSTSLTGRAHLDCGLSDNFSVRAKIMLTSGTSAPGIIFRGDATCANYLGVRVTTTLCTLRNQGGQLYSYTFPVAKSTGVWIDVEVRVVGTTITVIVDGATVHTRTVATHTDGLRVGINTGASNSTSWDDFTVEAI